MLRYVLYIYSSHMRFIRIVSKTAFVLLILLVLGGGGVIWYLNQDLPDVNTLRTMPLQVPLRVFTADGKLLAEFGEKRREPVPLSAIPLPLQQAVIATEDQRFYQHSGVDFRGLMRAAYEVAASGKKVQGGSTITMQVARNFFLDRQKTYARKVKEILLALKISRELDKEKVLELYLNKVYFGKRAYGVLAAAHVYYGKNLDQLTLAQMAMLAGLPQAPSALNPINDPVSAKERRMHVLQRMLEQGYINKAQFDEANNEPITAKYHHLNVEVTAPYVAEMARDAMVKQYGDAAYELGLNVYTTINSQYQAAANKALEEGLLDYDVRHGYRGAIDQWPLPTQDQIAATTQKLKSIPQVADLQPALILSVANQSATALLKDGHVITIPWSGLSWARKQFAQGKWVGNAPQKASDVVKAGNVVRVQQTDKGEWTLTQLPDAEASLISIDPQNGGILALVGGFNFGKSNFNRVTSAQRQPGSSFKPFIYTAALDKDFTLASIVNDAPIVLQDQSDANFWRPQNDQRDFAGPIRLRVGLQQSRNLVTIRVLDEIGIPYASDYLKKFGFKDSAMPQTLSMALGTGVITPIELVRGYATFANGGYLVQPYLIQKITDNSGKEVFNANPVVACDNCFMPNVTPPGNLAPQIISSQTAYLITSALKSVITNGTGRAALVLKRTDLAGKTGTTQDQTDGWFAGFNTRVVTVAWLGFDQPRSTFEYGGQGALTIWIDYMKMITKGMPESNLPQPPDIVSVRINGKTGQATDATDQNAVYEIFRKENAPTEVTIPAAKTSDNSSSGEQPIF